MAGTHVSCRSVGSTSSHRGVPTPAKAIDDAPSPMPAHYASPCRRPVRRAPRSGAFDCLSDGRGHADVLLIVALDVYDEVAYEFMANAFDLLEAADGRAQVQVVQAGTVTSLPVAARVAALLESDGACAARVIRAVQHQFFVHGKMLDEPGALVAVAGSLGLDPAAIEAFGRTERAMSLAYQDMELARDLGWESGPRLVATRGRFIVQVQGGVESSGAWQELAQLFEGSG